MFKPPHVVLAPPPSGSLRYGVTPENIILYGQSIGTVPTVDLAARYECAAVILHSPLMSGLRVAFPDTRKTYCFDAFPSSCHSNQVVFKTNQRPKVLIFLHTQMPAEQVTETKHDCRS
ncbi:alpha/beta hydrolase domain-containing protein 17C [Tachysurus ichikawai]